MTSFRSQTWRALPTPAAAARGARAARAAHAGCGVQGPAAHVDEVRADMGCRMS